MVIRNTAALRSLVSEATRQADYFEKRGIPEVSAHWKQIAAHAFAALQDPAKTLRLLLSSSQVQEPSIKACEYCEQLRKPLQPTEL